MSGNRKTCTGFKINRSSLVRAGAYSELLDFGLGAQYRYAIRRKACTKYIFVSGHRK